MDVWVAHTSRPDNLPTLSKSFGDLPGVVANTFVVVAKQPERTHAVHVEVN